MEAVIPVTYSPLTPCEAKKGGRPFLDQVADCRSARSSAPRCMRPSAPISALPCSLLAITSINTLSYCAQHDTREKTTTEGARERMKCYSNCEVHLDQSGDGWCEPRQPHLAQAPIHCHHRLVHASPFDRANDSAYCAQSRRLVNMVHERFSVRVIASAQISSSR